MRPYTRAMVTFGILVVLIVSMYIFTDWFSKATGYVLGEDEKITLAQCLTRQNAVLYIADNCNKCDQQLALFGEEASTFLITKTCRTADECPVGAPAWTIRGKTYVGVQQLEDLLIYADCQ